MKTAKVLVTKFALAGITLAGLAACGNLQADKDYKNLNTPDAPSAADAARNAQSQSVPVPGQNVSVKVDGTNDIQTHEGKTINVTGTSQVLIAVPFKTVLVKGPSDAKFEVSNVSGVQHWTLTWKAPISKSSQDAVYKMQVMIQLGETSDQNKRLLSLDIANNSLNLPLTITVAKNSSKPLITISGLDTLNPIEGLSVPVMIDVNDPSSIASGAAPTLAIAADATSLSTDGAIDVSGFVSADASKPAQNLGDGQWKFFYIYNTVGKQLPRPKKHTTVGSDQGTGTFKVTMTTSGKQVVSKTEKFNLKFDTQKQLPVFAPIKDASQLKVTLGQLNKINVDVTSSDPAGALKLDATATKALLKTLAGKAQAACLPATKDGMACEIRWTPTCDAATDKPETVQIKVTNAVGGIAADATWTSPELKLVKPDNCGAKPTLKTPAQASKSGQGAKKANKIVTKTLTAAAPKSALAAVVAPATAPAQPAAAAAGAKAAPVVTNGQKANPASPGGKQ